MSEDSKNGPPGHVQSLAAKLTSEGIPDDIAARMARIAADHFQSAQRPTDDEISRLAEMVALHLRQIRPMDERQSSKLANVIEGFLISFVSSALFTLVQDYVVVVSQFFMSEENEAVEKAKDEAAELYLKHRRKLPPDVREFLGRNLASLEKTRKLFRAELIKAIASAGIEDADELGLLASPYVDWPLFIFPYRALEKAPE